MAATGGGRAYERFGWMILLVSAVLGLLFALMVTISPLSLMVLPEFRVGLVPDILRAWGITWVFFNVFALVILFRNFRRGERWAWWVLWLLPPLWLSYFLFNMSTFQNLVIAVITALGLVLPYRRFFFASADRPSHVG